MARKPKSRQPTYTRYPLRSRVLYNGLTIGHYLLGGIGLWLGYSFSPAGYFLAAVYLVFAFGQMYAWMPLQVCRHCAYARLKDGRCVTGLNILARRLGRPGNAKLFPRRAKGLLCANNLYLAAKVLPILGLIPALIIEFNLVVLGIALVLVALLAIRMLVIFRRVACVYCVARSVCPNAAAMGLAGR